MEIQLFNFNGAELRCSSDLSEPWFVAADVLKALGLDRTSLERLDADEKGVDSIHTLGGEQKVTIINESGLYSLTLTSRKPKAKEFKKWVTSVVLPAIRKTGSYTAAPIQFNLPANMAEALRLAADSIEKLEAAEMKLLEVAPKVKTYNEIMNSDGLFNFREVAGQLTALGFGSNTLVKKLVDAGVLYYDSDNKIRCYQFFTAKGYFKLIERSYEVKEFGGKGTGEFRVSATLKVTPAGVEFINRKLAA